MAKDKDKVARIKSTPMNFEDTLEALPLYFKSGIVPLLLGHTGIGKTQLFEQYALAHNMDLIVLHVAQLEPSDFVGLYKTTEDGRTMNCPPNWLPYKKASEEKAKSGKPAIEFLVGGHTGEINPNGGIVFLDEINRGHEDIRQALYQLITTKRIHTYALPSNYFIGAAANPSNGYETYEFDAALVNRFAWVRFVPEAKEVFKYLTKQHGVNPLVEWLRTDEKLLDLGDDDFDVDGMVLSPRMTENGIKLWKSLEDKPKEFQRKVLETIMVPEKVQSFISFQEELKHCTWQEVIAGKKKEKVKELLANNRLDVLSTLINYFGDFFGKYEIGKTEVDVIPRAKEREYLNNAVEFLSVVPDELVCTFVDIFPRARFTDPKCILLDAKFREAMKPKLKKYAHLFKDKA